MILYIYIALTCFQYLDQFLFFEADNSLCAADTEPPFLLYKVSSRSNMHAG